MQTTGYLLESQVSDSDHRGVKRLTGHQRVGLALGHCFSSPVVECLEDKIRGERSRDPWGLGEQRVRYNAI